MTPEFLQSSILTRLRGKPDGVTGHTLAANIGEDPESVCVELEYLAIQGRIVDVAKRGVPRWVLTGDAEVAA